MNHKKSSLLLLFSWLIGINGLLIAPFLFGAVYCGIKFTKMWNVRHEHTKAQVFERVEKEEKEREARTLQEEEQEVDNDKEYQSADFRVPPELMKKAENASGERKNKEAE